MSANVESMAYHGEVPWHGLGVQVGKLNVQQMLKAAKIDWTVSKKPLAAVLDDGSVGPLIKDKYALVRDSDGKTFTLVGKHYKPVQNLDAMDFFTRFLDAGHMHMETAGSLDGGRYIWGLAKIGESFNVGRGDDKVEGYLLVASPHLYGRPLVIQTTGIRVVCKNTFTMALGSSLKGKGNAFRMPHSTRFDDDTKKRAELALGLAKENMHEFKEAANLLAKKRAKPEAVQEYFIEVLRLDPSKVAEKQAEQGKQPAMLEKLSKALEFAPGQQVPSARGTWWGAFNAVTYTVDHDMGRQRDTGLRNAWLGHTAYMKRRALDLAVQRAK